AVVAPPPPVADAEGDVALEGGGADTAAPSGSAPVQLATGAADGCVKLWHAGQEEAVATLEGHRDRLARVAWHPAGRHLASTSFDYTWRLWDVEAQAELLLQDGHAREVYPVAFHPDGSLVATGDLGGIGRVWDLRSGKSVMTLKGHVTQLLALDMSPNGVNLATGSDDHTVNVWDLRAQRIVYSIAAHSRLISTVKFAPVSGAYLVTAAYDGLIRTWSARDWTAISVHRGHEDKITCVGAFLYLAEAWQGGSPISATPASQTLTRLRSTLCHQDLTSSSRFGSQRSSTSKASAPGRRCKRSETHPATLPPCLAPCDAYLPFHCMQLYVMDS
ncbi:Prpf4, partial [Symbiodinium sp. KB8]